MTAPEIVWFRRNLRVADNPALAAACRSGAPVIGCYVIDKLDRGGASRWWLHMSLASLAKSLQSIGIRLHVAEGNPAQVLQKLASETGAARVCYSRRYEPEARAQEQDVLAALDDLCDTLRFDDGVLHTPGEVHSQQGAPYKVFTPFWKTASSLQEPDEPLRPPRAVSANTVALPDLDAFGLLPTKPDWAGGLRETWSPGESGAHDRLDAIAENVDKYKDGRHRPDLEHTSRLSPHLHFGEVSPRQVWHALRQASLTGRKTQGAEALIRQLYWREFSIHLLFHFQDLPEAPLRPEYEYFPWSDNDEHLTAWQRGRTGFPIVDAGMRQLWHTGWMHNRVRMIVASFLVKNLMVPWQTGADWFRDTLVDADLANNSAGWQWVAGCGTDAAPYFRIFNPILQGEKFDPNGDYVRRWLPELAELPREYIHEPWQADGLTLTTANVQLGVDYPWPIVDLAETRQRALDAYQEIRSLLQSPAAGARSSVG